MTFLLLTTWLSTGCTPQTSGDSQAPENEDTQAKGLSFEGIQVAEAVGADTLSASWEAATSGGTVTYHLAVTGADEALGFETTETTHRVSELTEGEYVLSVEAVDDQGHRAGSDVALTQLVGDNRLIYRSELPVGGLGGPRGGADVWGQDEVVVIAGYHSGASFLVVDTSNPTNPEVLSRVTGEGFVKDIKIGDGLMFTNAECGCRYESEEWAAYDKTGARIFDFSDPSNPELLGSIGEPSVSVHNLAYGNGVLYLTDNMTSSVAAWDVRTPTEPTLLWVWQPPEGGGVHDQAWVDDKLYVAFWTGFAVLDVSDPFSTPVETLVTDEVFGDSFHNAWPSSDGTHVLTTEERPGGYLRIWNIEDPENIQPVGHYFSNPGHVVHNVHVLGDLAFVSYYVDGIVVLDISDPTNPIKTGFYDTLDDLDHRNQTPDDHDFPDTHEHDGNTMDGAWGVWPYGNHIAVGDMQRGLILLDYVPRLVTRQ